MYILKTHVNMNKTFNIYIYIYMDRAFLTLPKYITIYIRILFLK